MFVLAFTGHYEICPTHNAEEIDTMTRQRQCVIASRSFFFALTKASRGNCCCHTDIGVGMGHMGMGKALLGELSCTQTGLDIVQLNTRATSMTTRSLSSNTKPIQIGVHS